MNKEKVVTHNIQTQVAKKEKKRVLVALKLCAL